MTRSQIGSFRHGTFGFAVDITLSSPPDPPISLSALTSLTLVARRPSGSSFSRSLPLPGSVIDSAAGIIEWIVQNGDLTESGLYHLTFTLIFAGPTQLVLDATMKVT